MLDAARNGHRTLIMGILNVTPDSFSDGGKYPGVAAAIEAAKQLVAAGADIIDIGGESTRPATFQTGIFPGITEEMNRVLPVIAGVCAALPALPISIDTYHAATAEAALTAGACLINDVSAMRADSDMAALAGKTGAVVCLMHMNGLPGNIADAMDDADAVAAVKAHLQERVDAAIAAGVLRERILVDPGLGFGKSTKQNLELLRRQRELLLPGIPLLVGASRKRFLGSALGGAPVHERLEATCAASAVSILNGAAILRVHDVLEVKKTALVTDAIMHAGDTAQGCSL